MIFNSLGKKKTVCFQWVGVACGEVLRTTAEEEEEDPKLTSKLPTRPKMLSNWIGQ